MSDSHPRGLPIPPAVEGKTNHCELLRVWAGEGGMNVMLQPDLWEDPAMWGVAIVDIMRLLSDALAERQSCEPDTIMERIVGGLIAELENPTDRPRGHWLDD